MSKLSISEYSRLKIVEGMGTGQIPDEDSWLQDQEIDFSGGVASITLHANTNLVRINADAICGVAYGTNPTATTASQRWVAGQTEYRGVSGGKKYSAIIRT